MPVSIIFAPDQQYISDLQARIFAPMKKYLFLIAAAGAFTACSGPAEKANTDSTTVAAPATTASQPLDTLKMGNKTFLVYALEQSPFEKLQDTTAEVRDSSAEALLLQQDSAFARRKGHTLFLRLNNGQTVPLEDNTAEDGNFTNFTYKGYYSDIRHFGAFVGYYEGSGYLLVNQQTGEKINTWAPPVISPDKKYILCPSKDLEAGFDNNGFELLSYNNGKIDSLGEIALTKWAPGRIKWIDNTTLVAEYVTVNEQMQEQVRPVKLVMQ